MDSIMTLFNKQIKDVLSDINYNEPIIVNEPLSEVLDTYHLPTEAKLSCLMIDTAMNLLDSISFDHTSKHSILIGDLLSAHYYTILATFNDLTFQKRMSEAIIKSNELKSYIHHHKLDTPTLIDTIIEIETIFPQTAFQTFDVDYSQDVFLQLAYKRLTDYHPDYLNHLSDEAYQELIDVVSNDYIKVEGNKS
ncbi:heptaprenyl diphosphate synthase component 1 [Staphylococcus massiliensis]|uniref:Heptaprenyl pyrophosphate synthase subunit A n=1 Tax=Staphylococcus massiliensis S46 TaxID=1229783 RepID=K9AR86_9STAP|nr:heptaprenyl diphosphate synthase component 1 [Staphylococcus massiliensis]EKU49799.1 hypothetical protein C273_02845 [Staphylococcus massiliensis S46]MCG3398904.1 heptaprenyl diphosphate synthase component 1 [Staphylococcus massiliensis]MCG3401093.1 heptaprenyl diphosphate synthase component 1 [Staphylococcus massiliensis]MCG3412229.1 heptaprenyl diphosphate synthase component 1 [Staphylococcus massiliensis]